MLRFIDSVAVLCFTLYNIDDLMREFLVDFASCVMIRSEFLPDVDYRCFRRFGALRWEISIRLIYTSQMELSSMRSTPRCLRLSLSFFLCLRYPWLLLRGVPPSACGRRHQGAWCYFVTSTCSSTPEKGGAVPILQQYTTENSEGNYKYMESVVISKTN